MGKLLFAIVAAGVGAFGGAAWGIQRASSAEQRANKLEAALKASDSNAKACWKTAVVEPPDEELPVPPLESLIVTLGTPEIRGGLAASSVEAVANAGVNGLRACFEDALKRKHNRPSSGGRLWVKLIVSPDGWVQVSAIESSSMNNPMMEQCVSTAVRSWTFAKPKGGLAVITLPFDFQIRG